MLNPSENSPLVGNSKSATEYVNEVGIKYNTPQKVDNDLSDVKAPSIIQNDNPMNRIDRNDNTTQSSDEKTKKELTDWANEVLRLNNKPLISDLKESIGDGSTLFIILKFISGSKLYYAVLDPQTKEERVENLRECLKFLRKRGVDTATIQPEELEDRSLKTILLLVTKIRKHFQTHTDWVNEVLQMKNRPLISDLRESVGNGLTLPDILEIKSGTTLDCVKGIPQTKKERVENLRKCLEFLYKRRVNIDTIHPEELEDGNLKTILLLMTKIRKHFKKGCISCRMPVQLTSFNNNALEPGDHIELRGNSTCLGDFYTHHAIVKQVNNISDDGQIASVRVIDIPIKPPGNCCGKNTNKCGCVKTTPVKDHTLNDKETINCQDIKRIDYRIRNNDKKASFETAQSKLPSVDTCYCLCCWNCEHFTTEVINDGGSGAGLGQQTCELSFFVLHIIMFGLTVFFYLQNFYVYAIVAQKDDSFKHSFIPKGLISFANSSTCYFPNATRGFEMRCDWYFLAIIEFCYFVVFGCVLFRYSRLNICPLCKISHVVASVFKMIWFALVDLFNIFFEKILYFGISGSDSPAYVTVLVILWISLCETVIAYQLAYVCKKLVMCLCCRNCECCKTCRCLVNLTTGIWETCMQCCETCRKCCCCWCRKLWVCLEICISCPFWVCWECFDCLQKCCTSFFTDCFCKNNTLCACCCEKCQIESDEHYYKYKVV